MIISHKHKFIFIKTAKTAGTSIEVALREHCGDSDVITPIIEEDTGDLPNGIRKAQNYTKPFSWYTPNDWQHLIKNWKRPMLFNHYPAYDLMLSIEPEIWSSYYKFCFARNPWDRVISYYYWTLYREDQIHKEVSMDEFIASEDTKRLDRRGYQLYTRQDAVLVDKVYAFEDLQTSLADICERFSLPSLELPKLKSGYRKDKRPYAEVLTQQQADAISKIFAKEIAYMGYVY